MSIRGHSRARYYRKRQPGYETKEELEAKEYFTGDMTTDSIDFSEAMPDANIKSLMMEQSSITRIGIQAESGAKALVSRLVGGFLNIAKQWFTWRLDDNYITYFVRAMLGVTLAVYVFYVLYQKHLNRYLFQVKYTLPYILELDL